MLTLQRYMLRRCSRDSQKYVQALIDRYSTLTANSTAGIIVIGDEILKAQVKDTNSYYMCTLLYECGVKVKKISVVSDNVLDIEKELRDFSKRYTYVITSGGVGPTHDDVTYEGLSRAFDDQLHYHPTLVNIIENRFGYKDRTSPSYKMAYVPTKASLIFGKNEDTGESFLYPCINVNNVYVFPGSPVFFEKSFRGLCKKLFSTSRSFAKEVIYLNATEESFANILTSVTKEFPNISFGSYPISNCSYYKTLVTIESDKKEETRRAKDRFCSLLPSNVLVEYDSTPYLEPASKYRKLLQKYQRSEIFERAYEKISTIYRQPDEVAISFDGSRESVIILHLARITCIEKKLQIIHFKEGDSSEQIESFLKDISKKYNVHVYTLDGDLRQAVKELTMLKPHLKTLLMGVRKCDDRKGLFHDVAMKERFDGLNVKCPLTDWTDDDVRIFTTGLSLPYITWTEKGLRG